MTTASRRTKAFIGADAGTSGCKTVVLDEDGRLLSQAWCPYTTTRHADGEVSQDARDWTAAVAETIRSCVGRLGIGVSIEGLCVTAPAHNAVLVGADGEPISRVLLWSDARPAQVADDLRRAYGETIFERAYVDLGPAWTLPQLVWLRRTQLSSQELSRVRHVLVVKDYIRYCMTGEVATDPSDAAGTAMFDQRQGSWLEPLCRECGLDSEQLPPIRPSLASGGSLSADWSRLTGIAAGTPVTVGATDTAAELVSVGAIDAQAGLWKIASTGTVVAVSDRPHPDRRVLTYPHAISGRWYTVAATNTAATAYQWLKEVLFAPESAQTHDFYQHMDSLAARVPAGSGGVLFQPFLEGERSPYWDPNLRAAFLGVSSAHGRPHLCRAVLEGVALSLRTCRDLLEGMGLTVREPYLTGGGNSSRLWSSILVSVLGEVGYTSTPHGPAVGAALMARAAAKGSSEANPLDGFEPVRQAISPNRDWLATYDRLYDVYRHAATVLPQTSYSLVDLGR